MHRSSAPRAVDAHAFVYLSDEPGTAQIFAASGKEGDKPTQLTSFPDRVTNLRVAPGGKHLLFLKDQGGDENDQIYRLELGKPGAEAVALTDDPKVKNTLPVFDDKGKRIAFTSNARNGKDMDVYVDAFAEAPKPPAKPADAKANAKAKADAKPDVKANAKKPKPAFEVAGNWFVTDFQGDRILAIEARSNVDQDVWLLDAGKKTRKLLTKHEGDAIYEAARFSRDGKRVFVLTNVGREFIGLQAIDVASGKSEWLHQEEHDLLGLTTPRWAVTKKGEGDVLAFVRNGAGLEQLVLMTIDGAGAKIHETDVRGVIGTLDFDPSGTSLFVSAESSTVPTEVYRVDVANHAVARETHSDHAGVDEKMLVKEQLLSFDSFDGKKISYFWWSRGVEGQKSPVVIEVHGGPEGQAQPWFSAVRQYLALSGYAVVAPNVRGSTGYGKTFAHLDDKDKREDSVHDLSVLGKVLAARPDVDPKKIALYGGSYGGYMVLAGLTLYPDQWAAGVDIVGIANFRTFLEQTAPYRRALREAEYGSLEKDGALLDRISPIHKVDKIAAPLMVIHGTRDPRVPIGEAKQIVAALEKRGTPVTLMTFEDEGHGLAKLKNRLVAYPAMVKFLDQFVKHRNG